MEKKELYLIEDTEEPTLSQLEKISHNLHIALNCYTTVQVQTWCHSAYDNGRPYTNYWLGLDHPHQSNTYNTWAEVLLEYRRLMEEATPNA